MILIRWLSIGILLTYPFVVLAALEFVSPRVVGCFLAILLVLRALLLERNNKIMPIAPICVGTGILLGLYSLVSNSERTLLYYPVLINASLGILFLTSLWTPIPVIERFARLQNPNLPDAAATYCRKLTKFWVVFFVLNSLIAASTASLGTYTIWKWYNGVISYVVVALLIVLEYAYRTFFVIPRIRGTRTQ